MKMGNLERLALLRADGRTILHHDMGNLFRDNKLLHQVMSGSWGSLGELGIGFFRSPGVAAESLDVNDI